MPMILCGSAAFLILEHASGAEFEAAPYDPPPESQGGGRTLVTKKLGSPDFEPTAERPVGWRGDWTGRFPGATPPAAWSRRAIGITRDIRYQAGKPSGEAGSDSHPLEFVRGGKLLYCVGEL